MNSMNHSFDFSLKDKVKIRAIDTTGIVNGLMVAVEGKEYRVAYWINGTRHNHWLYSSEIEASEDPVKAAKESKTNRGDPK